MPAATIGGPNSPYAATPMNKRIGITIGGTRYFMFSSQSEPDRRAGIRLQHGAEGHGRGGKAGEHHHNVKIFLVRRASLLSPRRTRISASR